MSQPAPIHTQDREEDEAISRLALSLMERHCVPPNPENYSVWFHYAAGHNKPLTHEIEVLVANRVPFNNAHGTYLFRKYVAHAEKNAPDPTTTAQKLLTRVLGAIQSFSSETKDYHEGVDSYLATISQEFPDEHLKSVVAELIGATRALKQSGEQMHARLVDSTREIESLKKDLHHATSEAQRDFLTGVYNRKAFEEKIDEQMELARTQHQPLALLMFDIDHFKNFNDTYGHLMGDEVLKIVARTLQDSLKGRDIIARFGGEEFVAFLPHTPIEPALKVAEMLRASIAGKELKRKDTGKSFGGVTVSIGVSLLHPETDTLPTLIGRADAALYRAKEEGRNRVVSGE